MCPFLWGYIFIFTIVSSFPQYSNPNQLAENIYLGSSSRQGAWSNADSQGNIMPESDSIRMNSQQRDSLFNPTNPSTENPGSTSLPAATSNNPFGTQLVNAGNGFLDHVYVSPETGTTVADNLHLDGDPKDTPVDFSRNIPFIIASPNTGGGSRSPPNYSFSEVPDTESPQDSFIPPLSQATPAILALNNQATPTESGDRANVDSNIPKSSRQSAGQALTDGDSPLPAIPFSDILHNIFKAPSFDTPGDLPDIDKVPGQQPLYDPEERMADPKRPDCEDGTYAMCCSLGPPRLARTTPAAQILHRKRMCQICKSAFHRLLSSPSASFHLVLCDSISIPPK